MGKAGRWLRSFFVTGRKGRKAKDRADKQADADAVSEGEKAVERLCRRRWRGRPRRASVLEVDDGGEAPRACARRGGSCYSTPPAKAELYQKVSLTPSALKDASARTLSGRFDDMSFTSASEPSRRRAWRADHAPNYMANTESSRAKARSQSAPRQRLVASESNSGPPPRTGAPRGAWSGARQWREHALVLARRSPAASVGRPHDVTDN